MLTQKMKSMTRRQLLGHAVSAGAGICLIDAAARGAQGSANERLNIACVGLGNQGRANLQLMASQNIVALCDVDAARTAMFAKKFPHAKCFSDFRVMLDKMDRQIDAVVVTTPNHSHAAVAVRAMNMGKHVYCEKPLTHTVVEARAMTAAAAKNKVVTQMGTQIHAGDNYRRCVELVRAGAIGPVRRVHVWFGRPGGWRRYKHLTERPQETPPVPQGLDWNLWIGPAPVRPFHPCYHPHDWHYWWDFGNGTLGNMSAHYLDLVFWALDLGYPKSIETTGPAVHRDSTPFWLDCTWQFPARNAMPPVAVTWYHGRGCPPAVQQLGAPAWDVGVLFVGEKGMLLADYTKRKLLPEERFADYQPPAPTIAASIGCHRKEWFEACKGNGRTLCPFEYGARITETILLGNAAYRAGKSLTWDAARMTFSNCPEADRFLRQEYRKGWTLG